MLNAIRQPCKYYRITVRLMRTARTIIASSSWITRRYPCIADMHGMYCILSATMDYIVAYRVSDMHGMYNHIVE